MAIFEVLNELTLKVTFQDRELVHSKAGAMVAFQGDIVFEKELLGPSNGGGIGRALINQIGRRLSGENLPLMKCVPRGQSIGYFANLGQHVSVLRLNHGEKISVESESILAFTESCRYGVRFMGAGVISQKGLFTSTLEGPGQVAILTDGNPLMLRAPVSVDPDAFVAYVSATDESPQFRTQLSWKNLIGQASGESYFLTFSHPSTVAIVQPSERGNSGLDISVDGHGEGSKPSAQRSGMGGRTANVLGAAGAALGSAGTGGGQQYGNQVNGLQNQFGNQFGNPYGNQYGSQYGNNAIVPPLGNGNQGNGGGNNGFW